MSTDTQSEAKAYTGTDVLEVLAEAENYNSFLLSLVRRWLKPGDRVADFGAGIGTFSRPLAAEGIDVVAVELDQRQRARLAADGLQVLESLAGYDGRPFDYVFTLNVLEHIEDDAQALATIHDAMAPGGRLFVYVPAFEALWTGLDDRVGHLRRYRLGQLAERVRTAGFTVERARYVDSLGFAAAMAFKLFGRRDGRLDPGAVRLYDRVAFPVSRRLDALCGRLFGKNVLVVARKPQG